MRVVGLLSLLAGCSFVATKAHGPSCSTSYAAPMADGLAGGVAALPLGHAIVVGGKRSNGEFVADRDYNGKLILAGVATALVFAAAEETGRRRVFQCRRAKGIPLDREEMQVVKAEQQRRDDFAKIERTCETAQPTGSPADAVLDDEELQTLLPCDDPVRGGTIVVQGDGDQQIGGLEGCSRFKEGCLGVPVEDVRNAIAAQLPEGMTFSTAPPRCATMKLERRLYLSVRDWAVAGKVARAALAVAREKRLSPQDGIVVAVRGRCVR
jgi:hypothetical protein